MSVDPCSSNNTFVFSCYNSRETRILTTTFSVTKVVLVLPLYVLVVFVGVQRRRLQRSNASVSHSDFFTYNMVPVEMMSLIQSMITCSMAYVPSSSLYFGINSTYVLNFPGLLYYHCLTCVERYVAVVLPITYLNLRRRNTVRIIRIVTVTGCLIFCGCSLVTALSRPCSSPIFVLSLLLMAFTVVSFCSVSVLYVLKRPGPGDGDRADQSKQRAFYTIMAIMAAISMWMMGALLNYGLPIFGGDFYMKRFCLVFASTSFFSLPSSLVLPLLFLHRAGKLPCCSYNSD